MPRPSAARSVGRDDRRAGRGVRLGQDDRPHDGHRHRHRPARLDRRRCVVGGRGSRDVRSPVDPRGPPGDGRGQGAAAEGGLECSRIALLGCGRIGQMHAELLTLEGRRGARSPRSTTPSPRSPSTCADPLRPRRRPVARRRAHRRRCRGHLHEHRHARRADHPRRRGRPRHVLREADLARPADRRRHARRRRQGGDVPAGRFQPALRSGPRGGAGRRRRRVAGDAVPRQDHQPRPAAAAGRPTWPAPAGCSST